MNGIGRNQGRAAVRSSALVGCDAVPVEVEVAVTSGIESVNVVGMPDADVHEARERVRCAVRAAGYSWPRGRVLVNLAPSSLKKRGTGFDLAIAVGVLVATGQVDPALAAGKSFVGELALDGRVRPVRGLYCHALGARRADFTLACSKESDAPGAMGIGDLADLRESDALTRIAARPKDLLEMPDFADVPGLAAAKRAAQIAAAGGHGLLMVGPPGSGASMVAARIPSLMPPLGRADSEASAAVWSAAGEDPAAALAGIRPFRAPHRSITTAGLVGGGNPVMPGEASLAHGGVLYLERIDEFSPSSLQQLRAPAEEGGVRIVRAEGIVEMPARFMLAASAWPCPCGLLGDPGSDCTCTERQVRIFQDRLCGPLLDLFDIRVDLPSGRASGVMSASSADLRGPVEAAWEFRSGCRRPKATSPVDVMFSMDVTDAAERMLCEWEDRLGARARETAAVLLVARTIADMEQSERIAEDHLAESLSLRMR